MKIKQLTLIVGTIAVFSIPAIADEQGKYEGVNQQIIEQVDSNFVVSDEDLEKFVNVVYKFNGGSDFLTEHLTPTERLIGILKDYRLDVDKYNQIQDAIQIDEELSKRVSDLYIDVEKGFE